VHELSTRIARSVEIYKSCKHFSDDVRKHTRACIEATASLVCCANAEPAWFGGILELLGNFRCFEKQKPLLAGTDELFVMRWTCLSLVAIRPILETNQDVQGYASEAVGLFEEEDDTGDALVQKARECLFRLYDMLPETEDLTEVKEIAGSLLSQIVELEQIDSKANSLEWIDYDISLVQGVIDDISHQVTSQFPGVLDDRGLSILFSDFLQVFRHPRKLQFVRPIRTLKSMCTPATTLRNILEGQEGAIAAYNKLLKNLGYFCDWSGWQGDEMQRQLWHLQDLCDGGGLGFTVELFFLALSQLLSTSSSKESHSALYTGTFRAITSDWSKHKHSLGTQKLLLDIAMSHRTEFNVGYPTYIVDEFLLLLGNVFKGQTGTHIDNARKQFESSELYDPRKFGERVLKVLTQAESQAL